PNAIKTIRANSIFTNCARTDDGDVWWEGMTAQPPAHAIDWHGHDWTPESESPAAHPNARFTVPAEQAPSIAAEWEDPTGVPIDAMLFGGRRSTVVPLVHEAFDWEHGVFLGSIMGSETTAAIAGAVGKLRRDPFAMLAFCGYHMADYFAHWLELGRREGAVLPRIFYVNWFRKDPEDGRWLWPGFGENARVLEWVFRRCDDAVESQDTPIGRVPTTGGLNTEGLSLSEADLAELLRVDPVEWLPEIDPIREFYDGLGAKLPGELPAQLDALQERLNSAQP
ncbi:MAG: phosphoenolpyruvate carboxykinase (GTP), partial [Solirubrobacterales bacterium]|nr:phosphoenolpyruvate carboxykinase (GTP) [Solirubrobacterales bacterium]